MCFEQESKQSSLEKAFYETSSLGGSITMTCHYQRASKANRDFGLSPVTSLTRFHLTFTTPGHLVFQVIYTIHKLQSNYRRKEFSKVLCFLINVL